LSPPTTENLVNYLEIVASKIYSKKDYKIQCFWLCLSLLKGFLRAKAEAWILKDPKDPSKVKKSYEQVWAAGGIPNAKINILYKNRIYETDAIEEKKIQCWQLTEVLSRYSRAKILEVGSGNGMMTLSLMESLPDHQFIGLELTRNGCRKARENQKNIGHKQQDYRINGEIRQKKISDERIKFLQGSASNIPLKDKSVDICFTVLALEQMNPIFEKVILEIKRVTKDAAFFLEPFSDFNSSVTRLLYINSRSYLRKSSAYLQEIGLEIKETPLELPAKIYRGYGLVGCRFKQH